MKNTSDDRARFSLLIATLVATASAGGSCSEARGRSASAPTFDGEVATILKTRCAGCHGDDAPPGRWRATTYANAVSCARDGSSATERGANAPLLRALEDVTHQGVVSGVERDELVAWVLAGSPKRRGAVHDASFFDPRSPQSHGRHLRGLRWRPMLDAKDPEACGRCHAGAPARPEKTTGAAPGATPCTTCHAEPGGVLACTTCHGNRGRNYPPRDACFHPEDRALGTAHAAHVEPGPTHAEGLACATCHPIPGPDVIGGSHGNGTVDVVFDPVLAGAASYDRATRSCTGSCHVRRGGARPQPAWTDTQPMKCGDCHGAPPPSHYAGACSGCHAEANADGTALASPRLHVNGRVDLGDGSAKCGACHGAGDDPWPKTGAHASHRAPSAAASVPCETCHLVPAGFGPSFRHPRGGAAAVTLGGRARTKGAPAAYSPDTHTCAEVYCHGAKLMGTVGATPNWYDASGKEKTCGACHGVPPGEPHIASTGCVLCHGNVVEDHGSDPQILPRNASHHVDGVLDRGLP